MAIVQYLCDFMARLPFVQFILLNDSTCRETRLHNADGFNRMIGLGNIQRYAVNKHILPYQSVSANYGIQTSCHIECPYVPPRYNFITAKKAARPRHPLPDRAA